MVNEILPFVTQIFLFATNTFWSLLGALGSQNTWLYVMYMILSYRFILRPVFGWANSAGSDYAHKKRKE